MVSILLGKVENGLSLASLKVRNILWDAKWFIADMLKNDRVFVMSMAGLILFRLFIGTQNYIPSGSMQPTLDIGDVVWNDKTAFWFDTPDRGDVIIFEKDISMVKRVIGLPGDTIEIIDNQVILNGEPLARKKDTHPLIANGQVERRYEYAPFGSYIERIPLADGGFKDYHIALTDFSNYRNVNNSEVQQFVSWFDENLRNKEALTLAPGKYFVMGDNRDNSSDSRVFGFVDEQEITGQLNRILFGGKGLLRWFTDTQNAFIRFFEKV